MDFSSSGLGQPTVTSIIADGSVLINAMALVDAAEPGQVQVHVCEHCGVTHCEPGGWVAFRRLGDQVLWVPCFEAMEAADSDAREYRPPSSWPGWPIFDPQHYLLVRTLAPELLPLPDAIPPLGSRTAARLLQFDAPGRVLGRFPDAPRLRRDLVVNSSCGDLSTRVACLEALLADAWSNDLPVQPADTGEVVAFYLDLPNTAAWEPLASTPGAFGISSRGGPFVTRGSGSA
jgi:hypothetical protein